MMEYFQNENRFISAPNATPTNIPEGAVVFFKTHTGPNRANHVAIVNSVTQDNIVFIQSNGATKADSITINSSGAGVQDLPWAQILGFGLP